MIELGEFKLAVKKLSAETKQEFPNLYFDYAGIIPENDEAARYDPTPINTKIFSRTGGDGVHYSILELSKTIQPIVMTVPMNFSDSIKDYNWIISENLTEFLSIGFFNGWFLLEQLCYDFNWTIEFYAKENKEIEYQNDGDYQFVKKLMKRFQIKHQPLNIDRLKKLENAYFDELEFDKVFIEKYITGK